MIIRLLRKLTSGQQRMKNSIDYCIGLILLENAMNLQSIVKRYIHEGAENKTLDNKCTAICDFLKHEYETHMDTDEDRL